MTSHQTQVDRLTAIIDTNRAAARALWVDHRKAPQQEDDLCNHLYDQVNRLYDQADAAIAQLAALQLSEKVRRFLFSDKVSQSDRCLARGFWRGSDYFSRDEYRDAADRIQTLLLDEFCSDWSWDLASTRTSGCLPYSPKQIQAAALAIFTK